MMTSSPISSLSMFRNGLSWLTLCPAITTLPICPGIAVPGQWPGPWSRVVNVMPSYIALETPILGISMVPTCVSCSAARGSAGGDSGFGNVAATVVVVDEVVVGALVVVVDDVDVVGGIVVVVVVASVVATEVTAAACATGALLSELSLPHAATANSSAQDATVRLTASQPRRIQHSASGSALQQCTCCAPPRLHAGRDPDAVITGTGQGNARRQIFFRCGNSVGMVWAVLRRGVGPAADAYGSGLQIDPEVTVQLIDDVGKQFVVGEVKRRKAVPAERHAQDHVVVARPVRPLLRTERDRGDQALLRLRYEVAGEVLQPRRPAVGGDGQREQGHVCGRNSDKCSRHLRLDRRQQSGGDT